MTWAFVTFIDAFIFTFLIDTFHPQVKISWLQYRFVLICLYKLSVCELLFEPIVSRLIMSGFIFIGWLFDIFMKVCYDNFSSFINFFQMIVSLLLIEPFLVTRLWLFE